MYTILIHIRRNILVINLTTRYIYNVAVSDSIHTCLLSFILLR